MWAPVRSADQGPGNMQDRAFQQWLRPGSFRALINGLGKEAQSETHTSVDDTERFGQSSARPGGTPWEDLLRCELASV